MEGGGQPKKSQQNDHILRHVTKKDDLAFFNLLQSHLMSTSFL